MDASRAQPAPGEMKHRCASLAYAMGATVLRTTAAERMLDGPPSADPGYVMPGARSVVSFAVALDPEAVRRFMAKESFTDLGVERKRVVRRLYEIGDAVVTALRDAGHEAFNVDINNNYRAEPGAADVTEMTEFHPEFSHRYAAVAAGVGRLGWSGNLMTRDHGALVELGSVVTTADLPPDDPLPDEDHPCDRCSACVSVCPVGMVEARDSEAVTVGGVTDVISRKRPNTCCWIGCSGYEGAAPSGTWSNWSPYRLGAPLPENKAELDALCVRLQKLDPQNAEPVNSLTDYRSAIFDPDWFYYSVCGFCRSVCWADRSDRTANRRLIRRSGTAALRMDGAHVVADESAREVETPFGVSVVVTDAQPEAGDAGPDRPYSPTDREVLRYLRERSH